MNLKEIKDLIEFLEDNFPETDIEDLPLSKLKKMIREYSDFDESEELDEEMLEDIRTNWYEHRDSL